MKMKSPVHPGKILKHDCIFATNRTVSEMAEEWGMSPDALNSVCEGLAPVTEEIARKANAQFGFSRSILMDLQNAFDNSVDLPLSDGGSDAKDT